MSSKHWAGLVLRAAWKLAKWNVSVSRWILVNRWTKLVAVHWTTVEWRMRQTRENLWSLHRDELDHEFDITGITETKITNSNIPLILNLNLHSYFFEYVPTPFASGGVGMYINNKLKYSVLEKMSTDAYQALWIEIRLYGKKNTVCGVIYRQQ